MSQPIPEDGFYDLIFNHPRTHAEVRIFVARVQYEWDYTNSWIALRVTDITREQFKEDLFISSRAVIKMETAPHMRVQIAIARNRVKVEQENLAKMIHQCKHDYLDKFVTDKGRKCRDCGTVTTPPE